MKKLKTKIAFLTLVLLSAWWLIKNPKSTLAAGDGFWHTNGNQILDINNQPVKISGINWFGMETGSFAPHGLWSRGYKDMMDQIKALGFNTIRLPFSNQAFETGSKPNGIDYSKNTDLQNLSAVEIMDKVVDYAGKTGLKIILDRHRPDANSQSPLWYTSGVSESKWIADWQMLARRYANNPTVIGADLHNEPHDNACWGCGDQSVDWKAAAQRAGNAILAVNPNWLIIVEGVQTYDNNWYWWGGNLAGVKSNPVRLNVADRVVYSTHDYPASVNYQPWFGEGNYPNNLESVWDKNWGYIHKEGIAPILVGEFGTKLETGSDQLWLDTFSRYLGQNNISWTYWCFNPNSGDTGGILADDWTSVNQSKMQRLRQIQSLTTGNTVIPPAPTTTPSTVVTPTVMAVATPTATPTVISLPTTTSVGIDIWWPKNGSQVSGDQPFKAMVPNREIGNYTMYWQVDGGQLNKMENSNQDYPHKESWVNLSGWNWKGSGPYKINFVAKDSQGNLLGQAETMIVVNR